MTADGTADAAEGALGEVREHGDRAARLARSAAPVLLAAAEELYAAYTAALSHPEAFARGDRRSRDLVERSIRAELAVALGVSERVASREIEHARLLIEDLPATRAALAAARIRWEAGQAVCAVAATLPAASRAALDEQGADLAVAVTPTQLRRALARLRDELHEQPLADRHARAREDRAVWIVPELDGMATLCALLPAPVALGAYHRLDRIARALRDGDGRDSPAVEETLGSRAADTGTGDGRTLAQLRADALADLLCDGDVAGTTPVDASDSRPATFVSGARAEVRLMLAASTASGRDESPAELDGYGYIPSEVARDLAGTAASLTRVLVDPQTGAIASVGRTHRLPPPSMRLLVQMRDRTCRFPGCTRPAATAEIDHALEWRRGGETAVGNLASLCTGHHHVRHGDRWTYVLDPDGTADWTTPTGRRVTTRPVAFSVRAPEHGPTSGSDDRPPPPF